MITKQVFYTSPYQKELKKCKVISTQPAKGGLLNIILDQTIFYPEGGGQPSDRGTLRKESAIARIQQVRRIKGEIVHQANIEGQLKVGDLVDEEINWNRRYLFMRIHSAGHLIHDVLSAQKESLTPLSGNHGKRPFIEYQGLVQKGKDEIEAAVNKVLEKNLKIVTKKATHKEIREECTFIPPNLPKNKPLRMIKIGDYSGMPDGGVQVKSTKEIGRIQISKIEIKNKKSKVYYKVIN